jgi:phosphatidylserine/phosphatidylglycerophosphate/cardiolipin synthase-like enzyme
MVRVEPSADGSQTSNWTHNPRCGTATHSAGVSHECTTTVADLGSPLDSAVDLNERAASDTSTSTIRHNKFLVFDGQVTRTGSANLTGTGQTLNANNSIVVTDTVVAGIYTTEFEEMWAGPGSASRPCRARNTSPR